MNTNRPSHTLPHITDDSYLSYDMLSRLQAILGDHGNNLVKLHDSVRSFGPCSQPVLEKIQIEVHELGVIRDRLGRIYEKQFAENKNTPKT